jgi:hypothetical protein
MCEGTENAKRFAGKAALQQAEKSGSVGVIAVPAHLATRVVTGRLVALLFGAYFCGHEHFDEGRG